MATPPASRIARVVVDVPLPQPLDYRLAVSDASVGQVCVVPFGRRARMGLIVDTAGQTDIDPGRIKDIGLVVDQVRPLDRHWLDFTQFASDYYQHPWGEVALPALPPVLRTPPGPRFAQALASADYALFTDGTHRISYDDVVMVMRETGHALPSLYRETSTAGLAKAYSRRKRQLRR